MDDLRTRTITSKGLSTTAAGDMDHCREVNHGLRSKRGRKRFYVYPNNDAQYGVGQNPYISDLITTLNRRHVVVNGPTKLGIIDMLLNIFRIDILYLNWVED